MLALKILGGVLGGILLLIAVILALPVSVILLRDGERPFLILYRFLWFTFGEEPDPDNPVTKAAVKVLGLDRLESVDKLKQETDRNGVAETAGDLALVLKELLGRVIWILPRCKVKTLRIRSISAGEDAAAVAMDYGMVCAVVYPLIGWIESALRVSRRGKKVEIGCDYDAEESTFEMNVRLSVRIWTVLLALIHIVRENVKNQVYKEMSS
ncbi:MAG: hypothetical protein J6X61_03650 [Clostridia bacterium]|nr:hypothetical protein [Clostridia bacterium]